MKKKVMFLVVLVILLGMCDSLAMKAAIGVGPWEAMQLSLSNVVNIKVGTVGIFFNCICIIAEIVILKKDFRRIQLLQMVVTVVLGIVVNFMLYNVYTFAIYAYWQRVILILISYVLTAMVLGIIMLLDIVTLPLEGFCKVVSDINPISFPVMRQLMDVISIIVSLIITFMFGARLTSREGTVIGMLIFGPLMGIFMKIEKPLLLKIGLMEE
jgi:uncharacterized protein